jgi:hypothetical protein
VAAAGALGALIIAVRYPDSRRWIMALAALFVFGAAALLVMTIAALSRMDVGGGLPIEAVIGSGALAIVGLVLAGLIAFIRRRPIES